MSESETSKKQAEVDATHSVTPGPPPCLPFEEMLMRMAAGCECRHGGFTMPRGAEPEGSERRAAATGGDR